MDHPGIRYEVYSQRDRLGPRMTFRNFSDASSMAVEKSITSMTAYVIDVYVSSKAAAYRFGGSVAASRYKKLKPSSDEVFERIEVRADSLGGGY